MKAADKECRGDISFVKGGRALRDAKRREKTADVLLQLDRSARIVAQAAARKHALNVGYSDPTTRRRERRRLIAKSLAEYRVALGPVLAWFAAAEPEHSGERSPMLALLERQNG